MIVIVILLFIIFLIIIGSGLYIYRNRKVRTQENINKLNSLTDNDNGNRIFNIEQQKLKDSNAKLNSVSQSLNDVYPNSIDSEELSSAIKSETKKMCVVYPTLNKCGANYELINGCCEIKDEKVPNANQQKINMAKTFAKELVVGELAEMIMKKMLKKGLKKAGFKAGTKVGLKVGTKLGINFGVKIASLSARMGVKMAASAAKTGASASAGPAGWVVGAVMMVFDLVNIFVDVADVSGYNSYISNDKLVQTRNQYDYADLQRSVEGNLDYPFLFPIDEIYHNEFELALQEYPVQMQSLVDQEMEKDPSMEELFLDWIMKLEDNEEEPFPDKLMEFNEKVYSKNHIQRDKIIFQELTKLLGERIVNLEFYEFMSTPKRIGISLSEKGAIEWNKTNHEIWLKNNDIHKNITPENFVNPTVAAYTDTYYTLDKSNPGTKQNPNMIIAKLPKKTVLGKFHGVIVSYCEKERHTGKLSDKIIPTAYGVNFDYSSGVCIYTKKYCARYAMELKGNDCKKLAGQKGAEMIFGETITGASVSEWQDRKAAFKSGDAGKIAAATAKTIFDPTGLGTSTVKRIEKEIKDTKPKKSKPANKEPCPEGTKDIAGACWSEAKNRGTKIPNKKPCPEGMRDDGTSCWRDTYGKGVGRRPSKTTTKWNKCIKKVGPLKTCMGGFDTNAVCNDDEKDKDGLCYKVCKPGYKDIGLLCEPEGGPGIKMTLMDRQYCPDGSTMDTKGLCYDKCPEGYNGIGTMCHPPGGAQIKKHLIDRWKCPDGWKNDRTGICWEPCPPDYRDDGAFCNKN